MELSKNVINKSCSTNLIFTQENNFQKDSADRKLTLKIKMRFLLTNIAKSERELSK